jgi:hypothetical protein
MEREIHAATFLAGFAPRYHRQGVSRIHARPDAVNHLQRVGQGCGLVHGIQDLFPLAPPASSAKTGSERLAICGSLRADRNTRI